MLPVAPELMKPDAETLSRRSSIWVIRGHLDTRQYWMFAIFGLLFPLAFWWIASASGWVGKVFLPSPVDVVLRTGKWFSQDKLLNDIWISTLGGVNYLERPLKIIVAHHYSCFWRKWVDWCGGMRSSESARRRGPPPLLCWLTLLGFTGLDACMLQPSPVVAARNCAVSGDTAAPQQAQAAA
jgi:hypothetical protein